MTNSTTRATILLSLLVGACGGAGPDPAGAGDPSSSSFVGGKADATTVGGDPIPPDEETLQWLAENGFGSIAFMERCVSRSEAGPDIEDADELPVGGGRWVECTTSASLARGFFGTFSDAGEPWCAFGTVTDVSPGGDDRVRVSLASRPSDAPWVIEVHHEGEEITLKTVEAFGARTWPVWLDLSYHTTEMKRDPEDRGCAEL